MRHGSELRLYQQHPRPARGGVEKGETNAALASGSRLQLSVHTAHLPNNIAVNFGGMMQARNFNGAAAVPGRVPV
jgi:hypothetical protein